MSAPQQLPTPGRHPRPQVNPEHGYFGDQGNWSDDPSNGQNEPETLRQRTMRYVSPSHLGRSSIMPGGATVPYNYPPPRRQEGELFASGPGPGPGPGPWPYTGHFKIPPPAEPPYTPGQQHPSPGGGFPQGAMYYSAGQYSTSYTPASQPQASPYSQRPYLPSMPTEQPPPFYTPPYQPPAPQQFSPRFADGRTGTRRPSIRARKSPIRLPFPLAFLPLGLLSFALLLAIALSLAIALLPALLISFSIPLGALVLIREKLKVQKLQRQLQIEKSEIPGSGASGSIVHDLMYCLHDQREQENQQRWIESRAGSGASESIVQDLIHCLRDLIYCLRNQREQESQRRWIDSRPDDRSPRGPPSEWQEEEGGAASSHSRFADAPGTISDADRRPSSHRYRSGDTLGAAQSTPKLEKRQTAPPTNTKAPISSSSKRAHGSNLSSEYSSAADRGSFPIPRRTESGRRSLQSGPRPAQGLEIPRVRHRFPHSAGHTAAFKNQDPAGDRPIADIGEDGFSGSDSKDGARGSRKTRPYRFPGEKVQSRRYNPQDVR
jgi:hypothetical protein